MDGQFLVSLFVDLADWHDREHLALHSRCADRVDGRDAQFRWLGNPTVRRHPLLRFQRRRRNPLYVTSNQATQSLPNGYPAAAGLIRDKILVARTFFPNIRGSANSSGLIDQCVMHATLSLLHVLSCAVSLLLVTAFLVARFATATNPQCTFCSTPCVSPSNKISSDLCSILPVLKHALQICQQLFFSTVLHQSDCRGPKCWR